MQLFFAIFSNLEIWNNTWNLIEILFGRTLKWLINTSSSSGSSHVFSNLMAFSAANYIRYKFELRCKHLLRPFSEVEQSALSWRSRFATSSWASSSPSSAKFALRMLMLTFDRSKHWGQKKKQQERSPAVPNWWQGSQ